MSTTKMVNASTTLELTNQTEQLMFKPDYLCHPKCVAQDALAEQLEARKEDTDEILQLRILLKDLVDDDPCTFDHHGYCQAHGWMSTDSLCPHARAKYYLAKWS